MEKQFKIFSQKLNLSKSELSRLFGVSHEIINDWLQGNEAIIATAKLILFDAKINRISDRFIKRLERLMIKDGKNKTIMLIGYETDSDFSYCENKLYRELLFCEIHRELNKRISKKANALGVQVEVKSIKADDYFDWLTSNGFNNTLSKRIAWTKKIQ